MGQRIRPPVVRRRSRWTILLAALIASVAAGLAAPAAFAATVTITPGTVWTDTSGATIQAHGEGITKVGGTYYWIGEDKTNGSPFQNIRCYSSTDLKNWTFVANVLTRQASGDLGPNRIVERPHVIYNASTSTYVMYMHIDNSGYSERRAGVATSGSVCGSYTYRGSFKPLGHDSLDDTLFLDGSTGYFISEDRTNAKLQIYQLSADFLSVASLVKTLNQYESPAMVKVNGTYFLFGSHLTGWATNDNQYATATSITGTWSAWRSFAPSGTNTCNSQTTMILPVSGSSTTSYVFLGDRWNSGNLADSRYVWQPMTINGTTASITCQANWTIDTATGAIGAGTPETSYRVTARHSGKVMDVINASTANNAEVKQWSWNGGANQKWSFQDAGGGYVRLVNLNSGKCLDVANASTADGANVIQYTCGSGTNQQWQWVATGSYFQLRARHSGKCLDVVSANTADGADIQQFTCGTGTNQQWSRTQS
jgi:ricin-type beta-trefoil lectin protein/glycosyl hydrolase family 43